MSELGERKHRVPTEDEQIVAYKEFFSKKGYTSTELHGKDLGKLQQLYSITCADDEVLFQPPSLETRQSNLSFLDEVSKTQQ